MIRLAAALALYGLVASASAAPKLPGGLGNLLKSVGQGSQESEGEEESQPGPDVGGILRSVGVAAPQVERVTKGLKVAKKTKAVSAKEFSEIGPAEEHGIGRAVSARRTTRSSIDMSRASGRRWPRPPTVPRRSAAGTSKSSTSTR